MKKSRGVIFKRRNYILHKLNMEHTVTVEDLASELNVSAITIRRDLEDFERRGLVERFYGGANLIEGALMIDPSRENSDDERIQRKRLIAKMAATLVEDQDTILINSSTTAFYMFEYLADKNVTIITNNANAIQASGDSKIELVFTGGEINVLKHSMVGEFALQMLKKIHATKCFIGVSGINETGGLSTAVLQETMVNTRMMEQATDMVVILAESHKIGKQHNFDIGSLDHVTHVITDSGAGDRQLAILEKHKAEVIVAS